MSASTSEKYGGNTGAYPPFLTTYGITDNKYGVIVEPQLNSFLLCENGNYLVQENGDKIALG
jgi:hypothetical protein